MENKNSNKILITILIILVLGLSAFIVYDKLINTNKDINQDELANNDNQNETTENNEDFLSKFVGKYQGGEDIWTKTACNGTNELDGTDYSYLELKLDGTYTFTYGTNCGSGYGAKGNYAINNNKIYLFNDECKITFNEEGTEKCIYPNCDPLVILNYTETNEEINITYDHYSGNNLKLEKTS